MTDLLRKTVKLCKDQTVLCISFIAAAISMFFIPPDREYAEYIDFSVIALLFCLMGVVSGLRSARIFGKLTGALLKFAGNMRVLSFILMNICFFTSMFVTNDVALLTFVPLTLMLYNGQENSKSCILTIVIQTAAANLGSMLTPVGNPQNLYLYTEYDLTMGFFLKTLMPIGVLSYILLCISCMTIKKDRIDIRERNDVSIKRKNFAIFSALFVICLLTVMHLIPHIACLIIVCIGFLIEPKIFLKIDYALLFTFVCFFVFVGNISRIDLVRDSISSLMNGQELLISALCSQVISNVPAAVMLSTFTENASELLRGVNIGGLGTPVASLASLISYQIYAKSKNAAKGKYMKMFLIVNLLMLAVLMLSSYFII